MYHAYRQMEGVVDSGRRHGVTGSLVARSCPNLAASSRSSISLSFGPFQRAGNPPAYEFLGLDTDRTLPVDQARSELVEP